MAGWVSRRSIRGGVGVGTGGRGCMRRPEFSLVCYSSGAIHLVLLVAVCLLVVET